VRHQYRTGLYRTPTGPPPTHCHHSRNRRCGFVSKSRRRRGTDAPQRRRPRVSYHAWGHGPMRALRRPQRVARNRGEAGTGPPAASGHRCRMTTCDALINFDDRDPRVPYDQPSTSQPLVATRSDGATVGEPTAPPGAFQSPSRGSRSRRSNARRRHEAGSTATVPNGLFRTRGLEDRRTVSTSYWPTGRCLNTRSSASCFSALSSIFAPRRLASRCERVFAGPT